MGIVATAIFTFILIAMPILGMLVRLQEAEHVRMEAVANPHDYFDKCRLPTDAICGHMPLAVIHGQ
jgi:hypothetical protein